MNSSAKKPVDERRAEILDVTCDVVIERGFGATRVQDVAKRIGVSTGLIHYHFDSKDALLSAAFQHAANRDLQRLATEVGAVDRPVARLLTLIDLYAPEAAEAAWMMWIDAWAEALRNPILRQISQDLDIAWKTRLEDVIVDGVAKGDFLCPDPHASAWRVAALLDGLAVQVIVHDKAVSIDELREWVLHAAAAELGIDIGALHGAPAGRKPARGRAPSRSVRPPQR